MSNLQICLWFDGQAREAAELYTSVLRDGAIKDSDQFSEVGEHHTGRPAGTEMTVEFEVEGVQMLGLNGGPMFTHSEAMSLMVYRDTQEEIDEVWEGLLAGGGEESQCGWLKDRFGVSWQVVPAKMGHWMAGSDKEGAARAAQAMFGMKKLIIADLDAAYRGEPVTS